jgi:predicted amino acid dehydrogenase
LPREVKLGCCIISAGKLRDLRTFQYAVNKFHVINGNGIVVSSGVIGDDRIFYLLDNNLLKILV